MKTTKPRSQDLVPVQVRIPAELHAAAKSYFGRHRGASFQAALENVVCSTLTRLIGKDAGEGMQTAVRRSRARRPRASS